MGLKHPAKNSNDEHEDGNETLAKIKLVKQPTGSNCCGQAVVAMITSTTLDHMIQIFRTAGKTHGTHLRRALDQMGIRHGSRMVRGEPTTGSAILKFKDHEGNAHWVLWHKNKFYDPAVGVFRKRPRYLEEARVTSHLTVEIP